MDLSSYLLNEVVEVTAQKDETAAAARTRGDAIVEMVCAYDPRDAMETMIACQCVMLRFLLRGAMRDAADIDLEPVAAAKARAGAMSVSRTLHQWATKLEQVKRRNEVREQAQTAAAEPAAVRPAAVNNPVPPPHQAPAAKLAIDPPPNGRTGETITAPRTAVSVAPDNSRSLGSGHGFGASEHPAAVAMKGKPLAPSPTRPNDGLPA
jgi:hypothetical protein